MKVNRMKSDQLTIFTAVTGSYRYSAELRKSFELVRCALPNSAHWVVHEPDLLFTPRELIMQNLPEKGALLFIREPALLMVEGTYGELRKLLLAKSEPLAVMPSDVRGFQPGYQADYQTLRGFERFVANLAAYSGTTIPYDGRQPWMFLLRAETLKEKELAEDPFDLPPWLPTERVVIGAAAYIHPFLNYYNESRKDMLSYLPKEINSLLDVGCSRGGFGAAVKEACGCRVAGVEMNRHEAAIAADVLDQVWMGDFLTLEIQEKFDCISCLDVLEHFSEPRQLLEKVKKLLNFGGKVLISVPNVGHWSVVEDLMAGRWDYVPAGILCTTHLRFYTRSSLLYLLERSGLRPIKVDALIAPPPEDLRLAFAKYHCAGSEVDEGSLSVLQHIVVAEGS